jgi:hypothetical protein
VRSNQISHSTWSRAQHSEEVGLEAGSSGNDPSLRHANTQENTKERPVQHPALILTSQASQAGRDTRTHITRSAQTRKRKEKKKKRQNRNSVSSVRQTLMMSLFFVMIGL